MGKETWDGILGVFSFALVPAAGVFVVYSFGMMILKGDWLLFVIAVATFILFLAIDIGLAFMMEW